MTSFPPHPRTAARFVQEGRRSAGLSPSVSSLCLCASVRSVVKRSAARKLQTQAPILIAALALIASPAHAQPSLDELLNLDPTPPAEADPPETDPAPTDLSDLAGQLDAPADAGDAFKQALTRMDDAAGLIEDAPAGLPAARAQQEVLALLDQVLAAATPPPPGGGGGGGGGEPGEAPEPSDGDAPEPPPSAGSPAPGGPAGPPKPAAGAPSPAPGGDGSSDAPSSGSALSPAGSGPLEEAREGWGGLPPRLREALTDGLDEPFSPVYRSATEDYYRRLSRRAAEEAQR